MAHNECKVDPMYCAPWGAWSDAARILATEGVVVIPDVFTRQEARASYDALRSAVQTVCPGVDVKDGTRNYAPEHMPPATRVGMFQAVLGNLPPIWDLRTSPRVVEAFRELYGRIRGGDGPLRGPMVTSIDGLTLRPPVPGPRAAAAPAAWAAHHPGAVNPSQDWAHTDQVKGPWTQFAQSQVVLNDSTASFVASPRSHLLFDALVKSKSGSHTQATGGKWFKIDKKNPKEAAAAAAIVEAAGGKWQIPIHAPAGAMIFWSSYTVHSAKHQDEGTPPADWRAVVYICHRPLADLGSVAKRRVHVRRLLRCFRENRMTNHGGNRMFPLFPGGRWAQSAPRSASMKALAQKPQQLWERHPSLRVEMTEAIAELLGVGRTGGGFPSLLAEDTKNGKGRGNNGKVECKREEKATSSAATPATPQAATTVKVEEGSKKRGADVLTPTDGAAVPARAGVALFHPASHLQPLGKLWVLCVNNESWPQAAWVAPLELDADAGIPPHAVGVIPSDMLLTTRSKAVWHVLFVSYPFTPGPGVRSTHVLAKVAMQNVHEEVVTQFMDQIMMLECGTGLQREGGHVPHTQVVVAVDASVKAQWTPMLNKWRGHGPMAVVAYSMPQPLRGVTFRTWHLHPLQSERGCCNTYNA